MTTPRKRQYRKLSAEARAALAGAVPVVEKETAKTAKPKSTWKPATKKSTKKPAKTKSKE